MRCGRAQYIYRSYAHITSSPRAAPRCPRLRKQCEVHNIRASRCEVHTISLVWSAGPTRKEPARTTPVFSQLRCSVSERNRAVSELTVFTPIKRPLIQRTWLPASPPPLATARTTPRQARTR
eukprot:scaffold129982_cov63-Phaeocystis_antarctica.AAC.2